MWTSIDEGFRLVRGPSSNWTRCQPGLFGTRMIRSVPRGGWMLIAVLMSIFGHHVNSAAQDFERDPINYLTAETNNAITQLQRRIDDGQIQLDHENHAGYLKSVLRELNVSVSSQTLVFSKTSLQRHRISPRTPRAIYFSDDVYIGFCQHGDVLEVSAADPSLGAVFYTLSQEPSDKPVFTRQNDNCLLCHGSSNTRGVPGHLVRSVYSDRGGFPVFSMGTHRIDHSSPIDQRWGGWYVTGTHGNQVHLGNLIVSSSLQREPVDNAAGQNVTKLDERFDTSGYPASHSDLIALMVLEHQVEGHNLLTRANFQTREAIDSEIKLNKELNEPVGRRWESTNTRIKNACESLVKYLLFCNEAPLTAKFEGTTSFASEFSERGPRDEQGRSLRDFDLEHHLFRFRCSYLVYSKAFDKLPDEARNVVLRRLFEVLSGADQSKEFSHLANTERAAIKEILLSTKPGLPDYWY